MCIRFTDERVVLDGSTEDTVPSARLIVLVSSCPISVDCACGSDVDQVPESVLLLLRDGVGANVVAEARLPEPECAALAVPPHVRFAVDTTCGNSACVTCTRKVQLSTTYT